MALVVTGVVGPWVGSCQRQRVTKGFTAGHVAACVGACIADMAFSVFVGPPGCFLEVLCNMESIQGSYEV